MRNISTRVRKWNLRGALDDTCQKKTSVSSSNTVIIYFLIKMIDCSMSLTIRSKKFKTKKPHLEVLSNFPKLACFKYSVSNREWQG